MQYSIKQRNLLNRLKAFLFDLDDTLYPEKDYVYSGFRYVAGLLGTRYRLDIKDIYEEMTDSYNEGLRGKNFNILLDNQGIQYDENLVCELVNAYRKHKPAIALPDESKKILSELRKRGYKLGLVTDGYLESQNAKVESLGLEDYMDIIICTDIWGKEFWKPHKRAFREACRILGLSGRECCYVADNPVKDFRGAKACGMLSIQVLHWSVRDVSLVPAKYKPDIIIERLEELLE